MNVSLTPKLEKLVSQLVEQGRYRSASEVVREGLRLLEIRESRLQSKPQTKQAPSSPKD
jgi:antitoxin ParD1/3/4